MFAFYFCLFVFSPCLLAMEQPIPKATIVNQFFPGDLQIFLTNPAPRIQVITSDHKRLDISRENLKTLSPMWNNLLNDMDPDGKQTEFPISLSETQFSILKYAYILHRFEAESRLEEVGALKDCEEARRQFKYIGADYAVCFMDKYTEWRADDETILSWSNLWNNFRNAQHDSQKQFEAYVAIYEAMLHIHDKRGRRNFINYFVKQHKLDARLLVSPPESFFRDLVQIKMLGKFLAKIIWRCYETPLASHVVLSHSDLGLIPGSDEESKKNNAYKICEITHLKCRTLLSSNWITIVYLNPQYPDIDKGTYRIDPRLLGGLNKENQQAASIIIVLLNTLNYMGFKPFFQFRDGLTVKGFAS